MLGKKISFVRPNLLEEIPNIEDYNLDVFVELEDGYTYTVVIATSKNRFEIVDEILYRDDVDINHIKDGKNILVILIGLDKWNLVERVLRREDLDKDKMIDNGINIEQLLVRKRQTQLLGLIKKFLKDKDK